MIVPVAHLRTLLLNFISYIYVSQMFSIGYGVTVNITASQALDLYAVARGSTPRIRISFSCHSQYPQEQGIDDHLYI